MATVLIIEDDQITRSMLSKLLSMCGYRTLSAETGAKALEVCGYIRADLILLDLMMPELDGAAFLERLRETETVHTPVIVMSALDHGPLVDRVRAMNIQGHFVKART